MTPWKLTEVLALSTVALCIWVPGLLFAYWSIKAGKFVELPLSFTGFMGAANAITMGLLALQQFGSRKETTA